MQQPNQVRVSAVESMQYIVFGYGQQCLNVPLSFWGPIPPY